MSEGAALYLILWLLYLSECVLWVGKQSVGFVAPWRGRWRTTLASSFIANSRNGALLLNPLAPGCRIVVSSLSPVSLSPLGICAFNAQSLGDRGRPGQTARWFAYDSIRQCTHADRRLLINDVEFIDCGGAGEARLLEQFINQARPCPAAERVRLVRRFIDRRFAAGEALQRLDSAWPQLRFLEYLSYGSFPILYLLAPILALHYGVEAVIIPVAIALVTFGVVMALVYYRTHKHFYPDTVEERYASVAKLVLCPPGAFQAVAELTRNLLSDYDPAVISALLPQEARSRFVAAYYRDLQYPLKDGITDAKAKEIVDWYRVEMLSRVRLYLTRQAGLNPELLRAPPRPESGCNSYCPRCQTQFIMDDGVCSACDGVPLMHITTGVHAGS